ncbi:MAG: hypothetical protein FJ125_01780 [Deltaproteobacteria bacterium]|nr:hypothetical protein [Deltaproteobacteria bacterium]
MIRPRPEEGQEQQRDELRRIVARSAALAGAAGLLAAVLEPLSLARTGAGAAALLSGALLAAAAGPCALLLAPLPGLLRRGLAAARRHPATVLGGTIGGLLGLRAAEAAAALLFIRLHRADLAGLLLALAALAPTGAGLLGGVLLGRRLAGGARAGGAQPDQAQAGRPPRWLARIAPAASPWAVLGLLSLWACWRVAALELTPHLPLGPLLLAGGLAALLLLEAELAPLARLAGARAWPFLALLALLGAGGVAGSALLFPAAPAEQLLLEQRGPLSASLLPRLRRALDRDGDGYSPAWGGGDCRDGDPAIHPGAVDLPGDGIDQDCLAGDAPAAASPPADPLGLGDLPRRASLPPGQPPFRSVLLLVVDALRYDATAAGGASPSATPWLDAFAGAAALFSGARAAAPGTWPSLPALLTGRYPRSLRWAARGSPPGLAAANTTLPELLAAAGIRSRALVSGYLRWRLPGLGQGFSSFDSVLPREATPAQREDTSPLFTAQALALLAAHDPQERLFLYVHYIDPHHPYTVHPGFARGSSDRERYLGELAYADHHLGRLLQGIAAMPGAADRAVIVTSDHGEEFGDHGGAFHAGQLYEESIHVPLVIAGRGIAPGVRPAPVSLVDLLPTILDLLAVPAEEATSLLQGRSLLPDLLGETPPAAMDRPLFAETGPWERQPQSALLERGRLKLIHRPGLAAAYELYDLLEDPGERRNLIDLRQDEAASLIARLRGLARTPDGLPGP